MNNPFIKLSDEIKFNISPEFKDIKIIQADLKDNNTFELGFINQKIIPLDKMRPFLRALNDNFKYKTNFNFQITSIIYDIIEVKKYIHWIVNELLKKPHLSQILYESKFEHTNGILNGYIENSRTLTQVHEIKSDIERIMKKIGYNDLELEFHLDGSIDDILIKEKQSHDEEVQKIKFNNEENTQAPEEKVFRNKNQFIPIKDLRDTHHHNVFTEGEIFDIKRVETKTDWVIYNFSITDYEDAIYVKLFARSEKDLAELETFKIGMYISVRGNLSIDQYNKELTISANKIKNIGNSKINRKDDAKVKRVELNARTQMSTMDGIADAKDYVNRAKIWGHKAVAIVDTDSVQSFPSFYWAAKDSGVKAIYGSTFSTTPKKSNSVMNAKDLNLSDDTFVVFDIETTGLSPILDEIIEFGATKIKHGKIIEEKQFFIKATKPLSDFTKQLTGITEDNLMNAVDEKEGVKLIADYIRGYTTVAHNANFDITFINEKLEHYGMDIITDPIIDTMVVARIINPEAKRFRLENVATRLKVSYDSTIAHRADYDANVLARVWIKMVELLKEMKIFNQKQLDEFNNIVLMGKAFSHQVTVLAKNQKGLKELFTLTSLSHTENFTRGPRLIFEDIKKNKNILMGSGALQSRLVDRMFFGSKAQIIKEISHYDYIEIQPIRNYLHYINRGIAKEQIEMIIRFVAEESRKQNKIVVATGDVRYLDERDKIYHQVYINAKGLGGALHYLFKRNEVKPIYPEQFMLTTKEMIEEFAFLGDVNFIRDVVINNTNKIADMIDNVEVIKEKLYTPKFGESDKSLVDLVYETARKKYGDTLPKIIKDRLERELKPILDYGFAVIYWISHLLVKKSLDDGYLVGSRGSVGSSLVATMAEITEVNPMCPHYVCGECKNSEFFEESDLNSGYDLPDKKCPKCGNNFEKDGQNIPFETFLGFNADKVPDIDLNFSGENQADIHNYVKVLFGDKHAFRAGTISTVAEKTAFGYVKGWAEQNDKAISRAFTEYLAKGVAGTKRTTGQHPGGIIVIPKEFDVEDFTPVNFPANDINAAWRTTHFDFHAIHDNVLKLDILGHDDPTAIKLLEKLTNIKAKDIPMSDEKIISLFSSPKALGITSEDILGETTGAMGIPEFGTKFVRGMLKKAQVTSFGDLISVSGLSHGTNVWSTNAEVLVKNENKTLSEVISCRDNIMIDLMNKGLDPLMSFNIMESVRKGKGVSPEWEKSMKENNVEDWYIDSLKKIKYMFPKAHATAYVMMAWRIAYFKLYHPAQYYATYFTTRADTFDINTIAQGRDAIVEKLKDFNNRRFVRGENALTNKEVGLIPIFELANEAFARNINIKNIDINKSLAREWIVEKNNIIPPFSVIDGLGDSIADSIIIARNEKEFVSKEDLMNRTNINKTTLGKLDAMDVLKDLSDSNQMMLNFNI